MTSRQVTSYLKDLSSPDDRPTIKREQKRRKRAELSQRPPMSTDSPLISPIAEAEAEAEGRERKSRAPAPVDDFMDWLKAQGLKTEKDGACLRAEWKAAVKGLPQERSEEILRRAKPGILWPSEFRAHRKAL